MCIESDDKAEMIKTCHAILELCDKPFVWEEEGTYQYGNYKKPFNLVLPHQKIDDELHSLLEKITGSGYLYDQINMTCTLDEEWVESGTYGLDRDFSCVFQKYSLKPEYVEEVKTYFNQRLSELKKSN
ncbi:MAG: nitrite reductase [Desulfosporosinus sp.]|nr:nitrite reductase [Desulfosporosinus sp.]MBC2729037.1 nitrite reductase [Desulfosporosinus sp.]